MKSPLSRAPGFVVWAMLSGWAAAAPGQELGIVDTVCDVDLPTCVGGIQGLRGARVMAVSPDGDHVYVPAALDDALIVFQRAEPSGRLLFVQSIFDTDPGVDGLDSARGAAVSPDGSHVYVAALVDSSWPPSRATRLPARLRSWRCSSTASAEWTAWPAPTLWP